MCRELASACGLAAASSYPALVRRIQDGVRERTDTDGQRTVLMLDEAHEMRPDVLGMLRVITNFEMDSRLVLSFVLAGQPPLATLLRRPELEDLARRIAHYATLRPLSREETRDYVAHRLAVAGSATLPFDAGSLEALFEIGRGNLRATDNLALGALETAALRGHDVVDTNHVVEARKSLCP
jgi:general secretion pathway protein A